MNNMAQTLLFIFTIIVLILKANGFSMEMIPIHSPDLQLLPQHFTSIQRSVYLVNISLSRAYNIHRNNVTLAPNAFNSQVIGVLSSFYVTKLYIGESPGNLFFYLLLDTGAEQTWVQCEGCDPCFELKGKSFAYKASPSFSRMSVDDRLCVPRSSYRGSCKFQAQYNQATAIGFVGRVNFYFKNTKTGKMEGYKGLSFGCAFENNGFNFGANTGPGNVIAGIHGLSPGIRSFLFQLHDLIRGRFSYCIPSLNEPFPRASTMYFGDDAEISGDDTRQVQAISMQGRSRYHLYLNSISVDGTRLPIDPSVFDFDPVGLTKGFIIDSGTPFTVLARSAHDPLRDAIAKYFEDKRVLKPLPRPDKGFELCYDSYPEDLSFPSVILHFSRQGHEEVIIDMVLGKDNMFQKDVVPGGFCLMVLPRPDPGPCLFGAFQQANFKILYDVFNSLLYFVPQKCRETPS